MAGPAGAALAVRERRGRALEAHALNLIDLRMRTPAPPEE